MRDFFRKTPVRIFLAIVAVSLLVYIFAPFSPYNQWRPIYPAEVKPDYARLYADALKAKKTGDLDEAQQNLQKIVIGDPDYKDAQKLLNELTSANLSKKIDEALARNQLPAAEEYLDIIKRVEPDKKKVKKIERKVKERREGNDPKVEPVSSQPDDQTPGENPSAPEMTLLPLETLPDNLPGFNLLQRRWIKEPTEANAAYRHSEDDKDYLPMTDMVLITVAKLENESQAKFRLANEEDAFQVSSEIINVNDHEAYFGLYKEKMFVYPGALLWTQGNWFFSVMVLPKPAPHDYRGGGKCPDDPDGQKGHIVKGFCKEDMSGETVLEIAKQAAVDFGY